MIYRFAIFFLICITATGCASFPESVHVDDPATLPSLTEIQKHTATHLNETVVLGGVIVDVVNNSNQTTLEILQLGLYDSGRPNDDTDASQGRFRITFDTFLEPQIYSKGRSITVRGIVTGSVEGHIGNHPYRFITLKGTGMYLWPDQADEVQIRYYMGMNPYPFSPMYFPPPPPRLVP